jgi:hypothetical protein
MERKRQRFFIRNSGTQELRNSGTQELRKRGEVQYTN